MRDTGGVSTVFDKNARDAGGVSTVFGKNTRDAGGVSTVFDKNTRDTGVSQPFLMKTHEIRVYLNRF